MREAAFHRQNAGKWKQFESLLKDRRSVDPDQLADLYIHVTDDLSFARTFYPESRTTVYLNALAGEVHRAIYRNRRERTSRLITFWKYELPQLFHEHRRELLYSAVVFALSMLIGAISALNDEGFIRTVMGDSYVNMTLENIRKGDPMAVYKGDGELDMFLLLTTHNIGVAFETFAYGLMLSVGTVYRLFLNGLMLGSFEAFLFRQGVFVESLLSIWIHGVIEIASIVIAGCAGLILGNSVLFPGTYTRLQSLRAGAKRGLKIIIGLVPLFVIAGFLESFVTRYTKMPVALSVGIILTSLLFVIGYVVIYPSILSRRGFSPVDRRARSAID
jgi:uncharacterized membrane protein SpoIIM required for sporulation